MKRILPYILLLCGILPAAAQLYAPGETLRYRVSYRAKLFPNTEVAEAVVKTTLAELEGRPVYHVYGNGRTLPAFRWFFDLEDTYTTWVDTLSQRTLRFESDVKEGSYTFRSRYDYDWGAHISRNWWRKRDGNEQRRELKLSDASMDAVSLFFNMRSADPDSFREGEVRELEMVLEDTIRVLKYRFLGREVKKVRNVGRFRTLKFSCQIGTTESYSFTDGSEFFIWLTDDRNKVPVYLESPIRIGYIGAYITRIEGLKYPLDSFLK